MEVKYKNDFKQAGHICKNMVVRCMDFRFHKSLSELLPQMFEGECEYDSPGVGGGGSKSIIDEDSRKVVMGALEIAVNLHQVERLIIVDHVDCGAYGGSGKFDSEEEERAFHEEKLKEAKDIIKAEYPELQVALLYQDWNKIAEVDA